MLFWQFFGEVHEGLLVGLLIGEGVFFYEVQAAVGGLSDYGAVGNLAD